MNSRLFLQAAVLIGIGIFSLAGPASADTSKLIGSLVDLLGVNEAQAAGGAGAIFKEAKNNMGDSDYSQLLKAIPGIDSLIDSAPQASGLAGKASSLLGGASGSVAGMSALTDSFAKLGLSPDMVNKYIGVILDYVQSEGGSQTMALLKNALL